MRVIQAVPAPAFYSPVYIVGGYRFQVAATRPLTSHEAIAYAAQWMLENRSRLLSDRVNTVAVVDEYA